MKTNFAEPSCAPLDFELDADALGFVPTEHHKPQARLY
jgi:hypothetical protein